jgi:hypothetical protein
MDYSGTDYTFDRIASVERELAAGVRAEFLLNTDQRQVHDARQPPRNEPLTRGSQSVQGLITSIPQPSKSFEFRVARLAPLERVIAAIMASN